MIQHIQKVDFCKAFDDFKVFVSPRVLKIEHFYFLPLMANQKNRGDHLAMIDLGKSKEVTAVLKL